MAEVRRERADAARNRQAILRATEELLALHRPEQVSMEQVAAAAGVGKGTVFHRFGSRMGLMRALMTERALALHEAVTTGPPPLGPEAPPGERLLAFLDAVVDVVARNKGLLAALGHAATTAQRSAEDTRDTHPVYDFWHAHITALISRERPDLDAGLLAHILLATLSSDPILRLLEQGDGQHLADSLRALATTLLNTSTSRTGQGTSTSPAPGP
ncbi:TetR/AcrR family transcriptional regulator [Streptomyces sp. NPDC002932]|uniref:TetR/AcrR family transcriptional regulator n=1 Tax=Streptomyces sp. NPDC002932 TaxID=3364672 RepID=UPI00368511F9